MALTLELLSLMAFPVCWRRGWHIALVKLVLGTLGFLAVAFASDGLADVVACGSRERGRGTADALAVVRAVGPSATLRCSW